MQTNRVRYIATIQSVINFQNQLKPLWFVRNEFVSLNFQLRKTLQNGTFDGLPIRFGQFWNIFICQLLISHQTIDIINIKNKTKKQIDKNLDCKF